MERSKSIFFLETLPNHIDRPDLYDGFDGLQSDQPNPVKVPKRLQDRMPVDYPCDVEPPYYEEVKDDSTEPTVAPEQSPTPSSNTAG